MSSFPSPRRRRIVVTITTAALVTAAAPAVLALGHESDAPPPPVADEQQWPTLDETYIDGVRTALRSNVDLWGEHVMGMPEGPTFDNVKDYLVPLATGGIATNEPETGSMGVSDTGYYYLPLTLPTGDTANTQSQPEPSTAHYALHTADGSGITADWHTDCAAAPYTKDYSEAFNVRCSNFRRTSFFVGADGEERYGSDLGRLQPPTLADGYLPILITDYDDADGVRYHQESFAGRTPRTDSLVSFVRFTATADAATEQTTFRVHVDGPEGGDLVLRGDRLESDGSVVLAFDRRAQRGGDVRLEGRDLVFDLDLTDGPATIHLAVLNNPTTVRGQGPIVGKPQYDVARAKVTRYWNRQLRSATDISVPEPYVMDAMRNILIQNLTMGWKYSIGNFYEQPYVPEMVDTVSQLGEFGQLDDFRTNLQTLLHFTKGGPAYPVVYRNWEQGAKLLGTARYYQLSRDDEFVLENLPVLRTYLDDYVAQAAADPHGILEQQRCCEDEWAEGYWTHHQLVAWQGWRDMLQVMRELGLDDLVQQYQPPFDEFSQALRTVVDDSLRELPDGSLFLPRELLVPQEPYEAITESRESSYWNLLTYYGYASGFFTPQEQEKLLDYVHNHGGTFLGMVRFNYTGQPIGECKPDGLAGYEGTGVDQVYGYQYTRLLSQTDEPDRQVLSLYGQLAHGFSRNTFVVGEGANIDPCPELGFFRGSWLAPLSANNAAWLKTLRDALVREVTDHDGATRGLQLGFATPRGWLADGERVQATQLPTSLGPVSLDIRSAIEDGTVRATVRIPAEAVDRSVHLRLRVPDGHELTGVEVNGQSRPFDADDQSIDLSGLTGRIHVTATYTAQS